MKLKEILNERGDTYGSFVENAGVAQTLKEVIRANENNVLDTYQQEALDQICSKISRILCGDPDYIDSWQDIAGYAQLVVDELSTVPKENN